MLTIFTIPKPFIGNIGVIQRNAIMSWLNLIPKCEIILFGDDSGIQEVAQELGIICIPDIKKNEYGTPYLDDVFNRAQKIAHHDILCYTNSDIIFFNDIIEAVTLIPMKEYLVIGERWDVDLTAPLKTSDKNWAENFFSYASEHHTVLNFPGMDYFIFPRNMLREILPFVVGRRGWDNWLIYHVRERKISVIDATGIVHVVHQNHSYSHIPDKKGSRWDGPESSGNLRLVQNRLIYLWELIDSDWVLTPKGPKRKFFSVRAIEQDLILLTPKPFHIVLEPFYRFGHLIKYGCLELSTFLKKNSPKGNK